MHTVEGSFFRKNLDSTVDSQVVVVVVAVVNVVLYDATDRWTYSRWYVHGESVMAC